MDAVFFLTVGLFLLAFLIIVSEKVHRTVVALAGAVLMILLGIINQEQAIEGVDFNTLGLLIGMMIIVAIAKDSGMFQYVAVWAAKKGQGKPVRIFILLGLITSVFSAFLDNVTTVLLIAPVVFVITNNLKIDPKPFLIGTIILSNTGGAATLIGDPPNILIGSAANLDFQDFIINMAPVAIIVTITTLIIFLAIYRKSLVTTPEAQEAVMRFNPIDTITNVPLLIKSLFVIGIVLLGFFTHSITHLEGATIALAGASLLLLLTMNDPEEHLRDVEWTTIFFFVGLFILVTGLEKVGAISMVASFLLDRTGGDLAFLATLILWGSALFSAVVDNIPFVATMIPLIKDIGTQSGIPTGPLWWALAMGADFGGNATLVGASANVVVSDIAKREGKGIKFFEYMKMGTFMTVIALIISTIYLFIRYI